MSKTATTIRPTRYIWMFSDTHLTYLYVITRCVCKFYMSNLFFVVVVLLDPFRGMGAWRNSTKIQQSATSQGLDEEVEPKWRAGEGQMRNNPGGGESGSTEGVRRLCTKNSFSVLSCIGKRTREGCDRGSDVGIPSLRRTIVVPYSIPSEKKQRNDIFTVIRRYQFCYCLLFVTTRR